MTWNYFVYIAENQNLHESSTLPEGLAGGFVDEVSVRFFTGNREGARKRYIREAKNFQIPQAIQHTVPDFSSLSSPHWLGLEVEFELLTPWYSKDDRVFHVIDNPVRKDRVFGVPFMAASSWKGMLRLAFQMHMRLIGPEKEEDEEKRKQARAWELHLFGNEKGEEKNFHQGTLVFYPTWFDRIGFEVINPHSRACRAGTQPIYYEVVPGRRVKRNPDRSEEHIEGATGTFSLLYASWPGMKPKAKPEDVLPRLLEAIEALLTTYGISAKRTVGWGTAEIKEWRAFHKAHGKTEKGSRNEFWTEIQNWLPLGGTP
ncbi:MAG: hypothetical protein JRF57_15070 [Deltaproteobacteria bacterium]|nr:hypothetical protein [Deltaproteobacteria bacterium]